MKKYENIKIEKLVPYENNARTHSADQISSIAKSIEEFGFINPVLIDSKNGIITGHGRILAAEKLGFNEVPYIFIEHLTEAQKRAYIIADNKFALDAGWNEQLLKIELEDLKSLDFDISLTGFELDDLTFEKLDNSDRIQEDDFNEELNDEPKSKLGEIYQLGNHGLMCGDATKNENVEKLMNSEKTDMVFTDPPYGMFLDTDFSSMKSESEFAKIKKAKGGKKYNKIAGDHSDFSSDLIDAVFNNFNYCKEIFLWGADYYAEFLPNKNDASWVVWDKRLDDSADKIYGSCFELCWSKNKHKRDMARVRWAGIFGTEQEFDHKRHHPTQKPIKLSEWFLNKYSSENNLIVDLFGGSGSTLIACEQLKRRCFMMELDPKYVDLIISRWEKFTGKKATVEMQK